MADGYTSQEIVKRTGVSIHTLRYYEHIGLLDHVDRLENGHRRYGDIDLKRLAFLKRLKATGMSLSDMLAYVRLFRQGDETIAERQRMLKEHRLKVLAQIDEHYQTVALLDAKIENYQHQKATEVIRIPQGV